MKALHLVFLNLELLTFFLMELVKANIQVVYAVFRPNRELKPAIIKIPLEVKTDLGISFLANMITLTPGTLTLDVSSDRRFLFVHVLNTDDIQKTIEEIKSGFETRLVRIYG